MEDLKVLRQSFAQEYEVPALPDFQLKMQPGGIRDIELFVHALQVIHGGKDTLLRVASTTEALKLIKAKKLLSASECDFLLSQYWHLRHLENLVQFKSDRQTHLFTSSDALTLQESFKKVESIVASLLGQLNLQVGTLPISLHEQRKWLLNLGFSDPAITEAWTPLIELDVRSQNASRDEYQRRNFLFHFLQVLGRVGIDKDLGLKQLHEFIRGTRAKATFFSLLNMNPGLIENLARLFSISPYLGGVISRRPELLDSFVMGFVDTKTQDKDDLLEALYDFKILEQLYAIPDFLKSFNIEEFCTRLSLSADHIANSLMRHLQKEVGGDDISVLSLGKWGAMELGLRSDLDFIFVVAHETKDHHIKLARRLVSYITSPTKSGPLYAVDLRLRPSGSSGPVIVTKSSLQKYLLETASAWEIQAYLRSRFLNNRDTLQLRKLRNEELNELWQIRQKAIGESSLKLGPGGFLDTELHTQTAFLRISDAVTPRLSEQIAHLKSSNALWSEVLSNYNKLRIYEQLMHICTDQSTADWNPDHPRAPILAHCLNKDVMEIQKDLSKTLQGNSLILKELDPYGQQK